MRGRNRKLTFAKQRARLRFMKTLWSVRDEFKRDLYSAMFRTPPALFDCLFRMAHPCSAEWDDIEIKIDTEPYLRGLLYPRTIKYPVVIEHAACGRQETEPCNQLSDTTDTASSAPNRAAKDSTTSQ